MKIKCDLLRINYRMKYRNLKDAGIACTKVAKCYFMMRNFYDKCEVNIICDATPVYDSGIKDVYHIIFSRLMELDRSNKFVSPQSEIELAGG